MAVWTGWTGRRPPGECPLHRALITAAMTVTLLLPIATAPVDAAGLSVKYTAFRTPVKRGTTATVTVHSRAHARCSIRMVVNGVSRHPGGAKTTNVLGNASWTWTVPKATKTGTWPVTVTCQSGSHKGSAARGLKVTA